MSKVDAQRAMREARYEANRARLAAAARTAPAAPPAPAAKTAPAAAVPDTRAATPEPTVEAGPALCGHRNLGGKTCRRPVGHPEKNHRYT